MKKERPGCRPDRFHCIRMVQTSSAFVKLRRPRLPGGLARIFPVARRLILLSLPGDGSLRYFQRIKRQDPVDRKALQAWLQKKGVTGYAQSLLELVDAQYEDRSHHEGHSPVFSLRQGPAWIWVSAWMALNLVAVCNPVRFMKR